MVFFSYDAQLGQLLSSGAMTKWKQRIYPAVIHEVHPDSHHRTKIWQLSIARKLLRCYRDATHRRIWIFSPIHLATWVP